MLVEDRLPTPATGSIELGDHVFAVLETHVVDAVFQGVQGEAVARGHVNPPPRPPASTRSGESSKEELTQITTHGREHTAPMKLARRGVIISFFGYLDPFQPQTPPEACPKTELDQRVSPSERDRPWLIRTYSGHSSARASNALYRSNLASGQTGLSVAFDLPTQTGYDSDHPLARGEVGKVGVPICHIDDMKTLFDEIPLDRMNTSMTINATAAWLLALYIATAERRGRVLPRSSPERPRTTS